MKKFVASMFMAAAMVLPATASANTGSFGPCTVNSHTPTFSYGEAFYNGELTCGDGIGTYPEQMAIQWETNGGNGWVANGHSFDPASGTINAVGLQIKTSWNNFPCHVWTRLWTWGYAQWRAPLLTSGSKAVYSNASYRTYGCGASPAPAFVP